MWKKFEKFARLRADTIIQVRKCIKTLWIFWIKIPNLDPKYRHSPSLFPKSSFDQSSIIIVDYCYYYHEWGFSLVRATQCRRDATKPLHTRQWDHRTYHTHICHHCVLFTTRRSVELSHGELWSWYQAQRQRHSWGKRQKSISRDDSSTEKLYIWTIYRYPQCLSSRSKW